MGRDAGAMMRKCNEPSGCGESASGTPNRRPAQRRVALLCGMRLRGLAARARRRRRRLARRSLDRRRRLLFPCACPGSLPVRPSSLFYRPQPPTPVGPFLSPLSLSLVDLCASQSTCTPLSPSPRSRRSRPSQSPRPARRSATAASLARRPTPRRAQSSPVRSPVATFPTRRAASSPRAAPD